MNAARDAARLRKAWLVAALLVAAVAMGLAFVEGTVLRTLVPFAPSRPALAAPGSASDLVPR